VLIKILQTAQCRIFGKVVLLLLLLLAAWCPSLKMGARLPLLLLLMCCWPRP